MKKLFVLIFMMIFLAGTISALDFGIDNYKVFEKTENYGRINIWDKGQIGADKKLIEYELIDNTDQCLIDCYAEGTATLYTKGKLFSDLNFKDRKGINVNLKESNLYVWTTESYEVEVNDYKEVCETEITINKTYEVCVDEIIGTHKETKIKEYWEEYNFKTLKAGSYRWRIEGKKKPQERIDWIGTGFGRELTNWAWWNGDWEKRKSVNFTGQIADIVNFTILMNITFDSDMQPDFDCIRVVDGACSGVQDTELSLDKINYTASNSALVYVRLPIMSDATDEVCMYYDNSEASDSSTPDAYDFDNVWHFQNNMFDSMGLNNCSLSAGSEQYGDSPTGRGFDFTNDKLTCGDPVVSGDDLTILGRQRLDAMGTIQRLLDKDDYNIQTGTAYGSDWELSIITSSPRVSIGSGLTVNTGVFETVTLLYNGTHISVYQQGKYRDKGTQTGDVIDGAGVLAIGSDQGAGAQDWDGIVDEIWRVNKALSPEYIERWHNNTNFNLVTFGSEQENFDVIVTQSYPVNDFNTTDNTVGIACNFSGIGGENITDVTVLVYDSADNLDYTDTESGLVLKSYNKTWTTTTLTDDAYLWACFGEGTIIDKYAGNRTFTINTTPAIQFEDPTFISNYNSTVSSFMMNVSLTETYFQNITFNIYNSTNELVSSTTYTDTTRNYNHTVTYDDIYNYSVTTATTTEQTNTTETRTINIDTTTPEINITSPIGNINHHLSGNNLTLNWSVFDSHLESCWYNYNSTNISVTCSDNSTQLYAITENSSKNLTFYANDTFGNEGLKFNSWNIKVIEINQTYNNITTEGSLETFLANIRLGTGFSITSVLLNYNNSLNAGQSFASGQNTILRKENLLIPNVNVNTNVSFYWDITLSDSTHVNLTTQNQTINNLNLDNCSVFTYELLNFTVVDEEKQTLLPNATIEIAVNIYDETRAIQILNLSGIYEKVNPLRICINTNIGVDTFYSLDAIVRYESDGFANEYYNIVDYSLTNATRSQKITLYDLNISDSTEFQLTFTGSDFLSVENALVYVNRQYIGENKFKTVELPKTDFNGQTVLHLVRNDVVYNLQIIKDGEVLGTFENIVAFCDDYSIGSCNIELNAFDSVTGIFDYDANLGIIFNAPEYNETTNTISFDFITSDGSSKLVSLEVSRNDIFGNRSICNDSLTSAGGTLACNIDPSIEESILKTNVYVDGVLAVSGNVKLDTSNYGVAGYLIMFVMALSLIFMFSGSKTGVLISIILTLAGSIGLGLVSGNLIGIGASGLWLIVIIIIGIYKINSERLP